MYLFSFVVVTIRNLISTVLHAVGCPTFITSCSFCVTALHIISQSVISACQSMRHISSTQALILPISGEHIESGTAFPSESSRSRYPPLASDTRHQCDRISIATNSSNNNSSPGAHIIILDDAYSNSNGENTNETTPFLSVGDTASDGSKIGVKSNEQSAPKKILTL